VDGVLHGRAKLHGAPPREVFGALEEADIVYADDDRRGAGKGRRVLHMNKIRTILANAPGKIYT
jgi:hypothetical protein